MLRESTRRSRLADPRLYFILAGVIVTFVSVFVRVCIRVYVFAFMFDNAITRRLVSHAPASNGAGTFIVKHQRIISLYRE